MTQPTLPSLTPDEARKLVRDEGVWHRGKELYERGAVEVPERRGRTLLGTISGTGPHPYAITLEPPLPGRRKWLWHCTCPYFEIYGGPCKHGVALLLQWAHRPETFEVAPSLDERLAGSNRGKALELIRETVQNSGALQRLLALEPERKRPLGRNINLAPFDEQIRYAIERCADQPEKQRQLFQGILETAAGYLRVADAANAARLTTRLVRGLLSPDPRESGGASERLIFNSLALLEVAALDAEWPKEEQTTWLVQVMRWWEAEDSVAVADRLLDLVLHCYRREDLPTVERWLRGLLRRPIQHNRLVSQFWRQRVRSFLLAFYDAHDRTDDYLELCWEEGEDALAARKLVASGNVEAALRLSRQGLHSSRAHRAVAAALLASGEEKAAREIAEHGLRYNDSGRATLLAWLAARAAERNESGAALSLAQQAWAQGPSLERYLLLRDVAMRNESWPTLRRDLHLRLEEAGEHALLVEILIEERALEEAMALLPASGNRREELTEILARRAAAELPEEAIQLLFDLAELRAEGRNRHAYARAAEALLAASTVAAGAGMEALFEARYRTFLAAHSRRPALVDEVTKAIPLDSKER